MFRYTFFIYICLLSNPTLFCTCELAYGPILSPKKLASNPLLSPDSAHDLSFAIVDVQVDQDIQPHRLNFHIENWQYNIVYECSIDFPTRTNVSFLSADPVDLRRLPGGNKVVLTWKNLGLYDNETVIYERKIIAMDLNNCHHSYLGFRNLSFVPVVLPSIYGGFDVFVADKEYCEGVGERCVIRYNSNFQTVGRPKRFEVGLDWRIMSVERLSNGNYFAHGFDGKDTYKAVIVDHWTGKPTESWSLVEVNPKLKVVSSGLSICWISDSANDSSVYCSQFDDRGDFTVETKFAEPITPFAVRIFPNGQLFVLIGKTNFANDDAKWTLSWAKVQESPNSLRMMSVERFMCTGLRENLMIHDLWRSGESMYYGYACSYGDRYAYTSNRFSISLHGIVNSYE